MRVVRFAARDPGAANILAAFLTCCGAGRFSTTDIWALPRAAQVFARAGIKTRQFQEDLDVKELERAWCQRPADVLITGTSHYVPFESALWKLARVHACPSIAILDQWSNLSRRFLHGRPDRVGAIDGLQASELLKMGFQPEQIIVVGHPWLSQVIARRDQLVAAPKTSGEQAAVRVLFVSECIAKDVAAGNNDHFGFDEFDSFEVLYRAACRAVRCGSKICLAIKFHPYEDPEQFRLRLDAIDRPPGLNILCLGTGEDPYAWVLWSDLVVGMSSMLLLEGMILARPVVSVQPGLIREDMFAASRLGFARTFTDPVEGETALTRLIRCRDYRQEMLAVHQSFTRSIPLDSVTPLLNWIKSQLRG